MPLAHWPAGRDRQIIAVPSLHAAPTMSRILPLLSSFVLLALAAPDVSAANARAVLAEKGKPLQVAEVAIPEPGPGQVRIRLRAAGVNPVDWKRVDRAAGGVGSAVVQLAKARGAWVAATASARNHDYLRSLGADAVIDYTAGPFEEKLEGLDVVVNTVDDQGQTASRALRTLRRGGTLVSITGPADAAKAEAVGARNLAPQRPAPGQPGLSTAAILTRIGELADAGKYRVHVEETLPLAQAAQAWERSRSGRTRGKLVLAID